MSHGVPPDMKPTRQNEKSELVCWPKRLVTCSPLNYVNIKCCQMRANYRRPAVAYDELHPILWASPHQLYYSCPTCAFLTSSLAWYAVVFTVYLSKSKEGHPGRGDPLPAESPLDKTRLRGHERLTLRIDQNMNFEVYWSTGFKVGLSLCTVGIALLTLELRSHLG